MAFAFFSSSSVGFYSSSDRWGLKVFNQFWREATMFDFNVVWELSRLSSLVTIKVKWELKKSSINWTINLLRPSRESLKKNQNNLLQSEIAHLHSALLSLTKWCKTFICVPNLNEPISRPLALPQFKMIAKDRRQMSWEERILKLTIRISFRIRFPHRKNTCSRLWTVWVVSDIKSHVIGDFAVSCCVCWETLLPFALCRCYDLAKGIIKSLYPRKAKRVRI